MQLQPVLLASAAASILVAASFDPRHDGAAQSVARPPPVAPAAVIAPAGTPIPQPLVTSFAYCDQTKPTSVANCTAHLTISSTSLTTGAWLLDVPLAPGSTSDAGIFLYSPTPGPGIPINLCIGTLCVPNPKRSSVHCAPVTLSGGTPNTCGNSFPPFSPNCSGGALGIVVGGSVNLQGWYRDTSSCFSNFSNAYTYDVTP